MVVAFPVEEVVGSVVAVKVVVGDGPPRFCSTQYSLFATSAEQTTPGLKLMNWASVISHAEAIDLQVSPLLASHEKVQVSEGKLNAPALVVTRRAMMPRHN